MNAFTISTTDCTYTKSNRTFVTEASDIQMKVVYPEINIESHKTGIVKTFFHTETVKRDGDWIEFRYTSKDGFFLRIGND